MQALNNKNKIYEFLSKGAAAITPNNRLSEELLQAYFKQHPQTCVDKPHCLPFNQALVYAYQQLQFKNPEKNHPVLLNSLACQHLWRNIIQSTPNIRFSEGLLKSVMEAWTYCEQWQVPIHDPSFTYTQQSQQFQLWWLQFHAKLIKSQAITEFQLIAYLLDAKIPLFPKVILWICFDEFNPQLLALQQHLQEQGVEQYRYDLTEQRSVPRLFRAGDTKEEYQQLIAWLHLRIQEGDQRIGVVVPNLEQEARKLQRLLLKHFDSYLFDIYFGHSLTEFHLVSHALCCLKLDIKLSQHEANLLLQSPYIAHAEDEFLGRAHFLQEGPLLQEQIIPLQTYSEALKPYAPKLAFVLSALKLYPGEASIHEWIEIFQERLHEMGFPGQRTLSSENYQCFNRFTAIFDEFRQLSTLSLRLSKNEALSAITALMDNTIFQAQKLKAVIQISGLLEASGCEFDSLWVTGLTDDSLPKKPRLSPFINPQLQVQLQMPHSSCQRELFLAKQSIARLQNACAQMVFSYPAMSGDSPNLVCSLIANFQEHKALDLFKDQSSYACIPLEEDYKIPLKLEELRSAGTALLANQGKCPFKAFAEHRLHAKPSQMSIDGLSPKQRGQIVHKVMEFLWRDLGSQEALMRHTYTELEAKINHAIQASLMPIKSAQQPSFTALIEEVEYSRIRRLALSCLEWERQRAPFVVAAIEQSYSIDLAGIPFQVRIDRLDEVGTKKWVIDYKSTLPSSKPWNEDKPKEPQLLLYALLDEQINTLFFMQLKSGNIRFCGISEEPHAVEGLSVLKKEELWSDYTEHWHNQLSLLAQEFQQGHCQPQPANLSLCQLCDFQNLCRFQKDPSSS